MGTGKKRQCIDLADFATPFESSMSHSFSPFGERSQNMACLQASYSSLSSSSSSSSSPSSSPSSSFPSYTPLSSLPNSSLPSIASPFLTSCPLFCSLLSSSPFSSLLPLSYRSVSSLPTHLSSIPPLPPPPPSTLSPLSSKFFFILFFQSIFRRTNPLSPLSQPLSQPSSLSIPLPKQPFQSSHTTGARVGVLFSGGVDSLLIAATAHFTIPLTWDRVNQCRFWRASFPDPRSCDRLVFRELSELGWLGDGRPFFSTPCNTFV